MSHNCVNGPKLTSYRPGGGDTICPPPRRSQFDSRRIYVRPRTGPQSAHLWETSAVDKLQAASVKTASYMNVMRIY